MVTMVIKGPRLKKEDLGRKNKSCTVCASPVRGVCEGGYSCKEDQVPSGESILIYQLYTGLCEGPWMNSLK